MKHYPYTLYFTRLFTKGNLMGLTHNDRIGFCDMKSAADFIIKINKNWGNGKIDYKIVDSSFQCYFR